MVVEKADIPVAAMPLYVKSHSYGEYVFDWQWANAFHHHGVEYYPKLVTAIPFTPATGPRILCADAGQLESFAALIQAEVLKLAQTDGFSSWHLLFPDQQLQSRFLQHPDMLGREDVQFHWLNRHGDTGEPFANFDDFLSQFRSAKRKQIRRERRKIEEQELTLVRRCGADLTPEDWDAFYACYQSTYLKRSGHGGYLNREFFDLLAQSLAAQCMLVTAYQAGAPVASSLFFFDSERLYGRYWGALASFDCLHFEACYYQGIEFAIERGLKRFDPGTQGEHKLIRGFEPIKTYSCHWVADHRFATAIADYLEREKRHTDRYQQAASQALPYRRS